MNDRPTAEHDHGHAVHFHPHESESDLARAASSTTDDESRRAIVVVAIDTARERLRAYRLAMLSMRLYMGVANHERGPSESRAAPQ